jgi:hypothetical protein
LINDSYLKRSTFFEFRARNTWNKCLLLYYVWTNAFSDFVMASKDNNPFHGFGAISKSTDLFQTNKANENVLMCYFKNE